MNDRTSPFVGRNNGNGAPSQTSSRTSIRRATSESRLRRTSGLLAPRQVELGEEHQPKQVHVRLRVLDLLRERREVRGAVDEKLNPVARTRLEQRAARVPEARGVEDVLPADAAQSAPVVA